MAFVAVEHPDAAAGRAARKRIPLAQHGEWHPASDRPDPVTFFEEQARTRLPQLVPVRHGRMMASPFAYFRGAALPMAADLAPTPTTGFAVQLAGDAHISNFGLFASPERDLLFDLTDFDETLRGPWEWDLKRLVASVAVAGRDRGFGGHQIGRAVAATARSYATRMAAYGQLSALEVYYAHVDSAAVMAFVDRRARPYLQSTVKSAAHHDALHELPKLTEVKDGVRRIIDRPPIIFHPDWGYPELPQTALSSYRLTVQEDRRDLLDRFELVDAAMKVVGVGSVGLGSVAALLLEKGTGNPLFLQVKEAEASVLERFLAASPFEQHGERVVAGQRRLQAASDVFLGWTIGPLGHHIYVRQLQDEKGSAVVEAMTHDDLSAWGELCGWTLARGHARSGYPAAITAYLGSPEDPALAKAFEAFASAYADQNERDFQAFLAAIKTGRLAAQPGV
ncbi:MAG TPA: DUF2252 domain-containing protein [Candidatus Dormibacteraeota bacterium]|nr:DUF2252 domain-containing protein [Candidatus Dormibacteraeota bacterium]